VINDPLLERVTAIALLHADHAREAHNQILADGGESTWPVGCCVDATYALVEELREKVPEAGPDYVWGTWGSPTDRRARAGHAWCALADGTIVDLTAGQWNFPGSPINATVEDLLIVPAGPEYDRLRAWWQEEERNRLAKSGRPIFDD
jgi:hypothetical protein